jgi:hypothetical protein
MNRVRWRNLPHHRDDSEGPELQVRAAVRPELTCPELPGLDVVTLFPSHLPQSPIPEIPLEGRFAPSYPSRRRGELDGPGVTIVCQE